MQSSLVKLEFRHFQVPAPLERLFPTRYISNHQLMTSTVHWPSLLPQKNYYIVLKPRQNLSISFMFLVSDHFEPLHDFLTESFVQLFGCHCTHGNPMETLNLQEPRPRMECQDWVRCAPERRVCTKDAKGGFSV